MNDELENLSQAKIAANRQSVIVIGMGYVGLTFSVFAANSGLRVYGVEKNTEVAKNLAQGITNVCDIGLQDNLDLVIRNGLLTINQDISEIKGKKVYVVTVGTPLQDKSSNLDQMAEVFNYISTTLNENDLIILRSTVEIGTTEKLYRSLQLSIQKKFYISMCPERTIEGKALEELKTLPQIISGVDTKSLDEAKIFFESMNVKTISTESTNTAEFIKLISNSYRDLNFAFANEISIIGSNFNINSREAIRLANYGYARNQIQLPGLTGGPCLEKDPLILAKSASRVGISSALLTESRRVNLGVPTVALRTISQDTRMAQITEPIFLILGIAFKGRPETSDTRGTLAYKIAKEIKIAFPGSTITGYDPLILENSEIKMIQNLQQAMLKADVILIQHNSDRLLSEFKKYAKEFIKPDAIVYDFWGVIESEDLSKNTILYRFGA